MRLNINSTAFTAFFPPKFSDVAENGTDKTDETPLIIAA
jgi:hypothetical protein